MSNYLTVKKMKKNLFISSALVLMAFIACQQEQIGGIDNELDGFRVYTDDMTKAVLDGVKVVFEDGDAIDIFADQLETPAVYTYSKSNDLFVASGTEAEGTQYSVIFPSKGDNASRSQIVIPNAYYATINSFPKEVTFMAGQSSSKEVGLKHLIGLWEIDIIPEFTGQKLVRAYLTVGSQYKINGTFDIDWSDYSIEHASGGTNSINLRCNNYVMTEGTPVKLYFALPEGTYEGGFSFEAVTTSGTMTRTSTSPLVIRRAQITKVKNEVGFKWFDSGSGTQEDPYIIKTAEHWTNIADVAGRNSNWSGKYFRVADNIDFKNGNIKPISNFGGTIDGGNFIISNGKVGDGTKSHQALFVMLAGTVKNLKFDNITVSASNPKAQNDTDTSAGVVVAGNNNNSFVLENCHVSNSFVTSGKTGDTYGAYAGGLVARSGQNMIIKNCSVTDTEITTLTQSAGGIIGVFSNGTIDNVLSRGNKISSAFNSGGVAGSVGPGSEIINCISDGNTCSVSRYSAGGIVGANAWISTSTGEYPSIINALSISNTMKSTRIDNSQLYLGLLVGSRGANDNCMKLKNCLVLSGLAQYSYTKDIDPENNPFASCVGILIGYGSPEVESLYFNGNYVRNYDRYLDTNTTRTDGKAGGWRRNAVGVKFSNITADNYGGTTLDGITSYLAAQLSDGTCLGLLNSWVNNNKKAYPSLKTWVSDPNNNQFPTLVLGETSTQSAEPLNMVDSAY